MKYLIASDIHGSAYYCEKLLERFKSEGADRLILLGDLLYHGPRNPLPKDYNPARVAEILNEVSDSIYCVQGNCDSDVDQLVLDFPIFAQNMLLPVGDVCIFATHGHVFNTENLPNSLPPLHKGDILLHGHTHVTVCDIYNDFTYMNPGSVSLPKDGTEHSYLIVDDVVFSVGPLDDDGESVLQNADVDFEWKNLDGSTIMIAGLFGKKIVKSSV